MTCVGCVDITGHVYDDVNGDGDLSDKVAVNGVSVYVYTDDGDNIPNAADGSPSFTTTTDVNGYYSFLQIPGVTYFVSPNPPATGAAVAEQTYTTTLTDNINGTFVTSYCDANGDAIADVTPINTTWLFVLGAGMVIEQTIMLILIYHYVSIFLGLLFLLIPRR